MEIRAFSNRIEKWLMRGILAVLGIIVFAYLLFYLSTASSITYTLTELPQADVVIILGAKTFPDGTLSLIFKDRVEKGITLYKEGYVKKILVTGDNSSVGYNEVNPVREYMLSKGIPSDVIFLDHAGFDTYSSMYRAREIFLVDSAIIVTQSFHMPRAVFLAHHFGIEAYGTPSDQHGYIFRNNVRELLANVKALLDIISFRKPKFLGEEIPITGEGESNPN